MKEASRGNGNRAGGGGGRWVLEWRDIGVLQRHQQKGPPSNSLMCPRSKLMIVEEEAPHTVTFGRRRLQWQRRRERVRTISALPVFASAVLNHQEKTTATTTTSDKNTEEKEKEKEGGTIATAPTAAATTTTTTAAAATTTTTTASVTAKEEKNNDPPLPPMAMLLKHPVALLGVIPKDVSLFFAGAFAGVAAKTITAPLDRIKLLMQTHGLRAVEESGKKGIGFVEVREWSTDGSVFIWISSHLLRPQGAVLIGKEEGVKGYWKGNLPQVIRIIPYSATQLFAYEVYKKLFKGEDNELSVVGRLAAGACAGMTSTLVTYPLDVLRLRLAVEPGCTSMSQVALNMVRDEGIGSFYNGLGPSLLGIAPYIAVNFCIFDLVKKSFPEKYRNRPESSLATALVSATLATLTCYPLDTVRRQMQMRSTPYKTIFDAIPGIIERDGFLGLYRGFIPNALKNLPNSSIRLTTFDTVKGLISAGQKELQRIIEENREKLVG